jgi:hypothetical protein
VTAPDGDRAGDFINALPSPQRETTLRIEVPAYEANIAARTPMIEVTMVTDPWLAETTLPAVPPVATTSLTPPVASAPTPVAGAVNIGSASTGANSGTGNAGSGFAVNDAGFNWEGVLQLAGLLWQHALAALGAELSVRRIPMIIMAMMLVGEGDISRSLPTGS